MMAKVFYSEGRAGTRPTDPSYYAGWFYQADMADPVGPYGSKEEATAALRSAHGAEPGQGDHDLLLAIQEILDGNEWTPDTLENIANLMVAAGYRIRDRDDVDREIE